MGKQQKLKVLIIIDVYFTSTFLQQLKLEIEKIPELEEIRIVWNLYGYYGRMPEIMTNLMAAKATLKKVVLTSMHVDQCAELKRRTDS